MNPKMEADLEAAGRRRIEMLEAIEAREGKATARMLNALANMEAIALYLSVNGLPKEVIQELATIHADILVAWVQQANPGITSEGLRSESRRLHNDIKVLNQVL